MKARNLCILFTIVIVGVFDGALVYPIRIIADQPSQLKTYSLLYSDDWDSSIYQANNMLEYGPPSNCSFLIKEAYLNCYNNEKRIPMWTYEKLNYTNFENKYETSQCHFRGDLAVDLDFASSRLSYLHSRYDRGHMAPASHHQNSLSDMCSTYYYSNVVPQNKEMNNGIWNLIENFIETITKISAYDVHVVTGPLFMPFFNASQQNYYVEYKLLNGSVAIPTHLFKVALVKVDESNYLSYTFLAENSDNFTKYVKDYLTDMHIIESAGGFKFFPKLDRSVIHQQNQINNNMISS